MAKTTVLTGNALTKKLWEERLFRDNIKDSYFARFMGKDGDDNTLINVKTDLEKSKGDKITFGIRMRLAGAGVTSGQTLEGNEESLVTHDYSISLERYRHAVRDNGELDRQRPIYDMDMQSRNALVDWGSEKIDQLCMDALVDSPTKINYGDGNSTGTITTAGLITPALIMNMKIGAKTGWNRTQTPLRPIRHDGKLWYILLVHPDVMGDLKKDSTYAQARREALERSKQNPIFSDAYAIWDNVVIHEHENVPIVTDWGSGSNVPGAKNMFMGAQALCWAWGKRPSVVGKNFDYDEEHGFAWRITAKCGKPKFNSLDYGVAALYTARTKVSDA